MNSLIYNTKIIKSSKTSIKISNSLLYYFLFGRATIFENGRFKQFRDALFLKCCQAFGTRCFNSASAALKRAQTKPQSFTQKSFCKVFLTL